MNRRNFILKSGMLGGLLLNQSSCTSKDTQNKFKLGYQLFSIRDKMQEDPVGTLKILKSVGYQDFEVYGYDATADIIYGYKPADFNTILEDLELTVSSGHYGFSDYLTQSDDAVLEFVDKCIIAAKKLHSKYITWPWLDPKLRSMEHYKLMPQKLNLIGEHISKSGLSFAYHNHGFEFEDYDGEYAYDLIMKETDPDLVKLQIDMYWVMHSSKFTPNDLINRQPGRFTMWHVKDMDKITRDYTELGNGSIDYTDILPDPKKSGLEYFFIEQGGNFAVDSTTSAIASAEYFKSNLQHLMNQ